MGNIQSLLVEQKDICSFIQQNKQSVIAEIIESISEDEFDDDCGVKKRRRMKSRTKDEWMSTDWGQMLLNSNIRDINTVEGKEFRRRYRIPGNFYLDWLVPECEKLNIFDSKVTKDGELMGHIPTNIKLLVALRILARGNVVDDIVELSDLGATTVRNIFKAFVVNFDKHFKKEFIKMPEGEELSQILNVYSRLGFPGAVGSMDCTHIPWLSCPSELTNLCVGKDPRPSLSFQVLVDHSRKIHHVSEGYFGGMNDINVCQFDYIVRNDRYGLLNRAGNARNLYKEVERDDSLYQ